MFRPMASIVSVLSNFVAEGHQAMHSVSSSPSKIPYGGFSPVRLQIDIPPRPSRSAHSRRSLIRGPQSFGPATTLSPWRGNRRTESALGSKPAGRCRSRGPWLVSGLYCPAGSSLTMASSEALASTRGLMISPTGLAEARDSPIYSAYPSLRAVSRTPADRTTGGCSICRPRRPSPIRDRLGTRESHAKVGSRVACFSRLQSSLYAAARSFACPPPTRTFTFELSFMESPPANVEYDYAAKQSIAATGLTPAGYAALWAATRMGTNRNESFISFVSIRADSWLSFLFDRCLGVPLTASAW